MDFKWFCWKLREWIDRRRANLLIASTLVGSMAAVLTMGMQFVAIWLVHLSPKLFLKVWRLHDILVGLAVASLHYRLKRRRRIERVLESIRVMLAHPLHGGMNQTITDLQKLVDEVMSRS